jgi:hypothetical protein
MKLELAKEMKQQLFSYETISLLAGLTIKEIEEL